MQGFRCVGKGGHCRMPAEYLFDGRSLCMVCMGVEASCYGEYDLNVVDTTAGVINHEDDRKKSREKRGRPKK